jgi:hypothetical protein
MIDHQDRVDRSATIDRSVARQHGGLAAGWRHPSAERTLASTAGSSRVP